MTLASQRFTYHRREGQMRASWSFYIQCKPCWRFPGLEVELSWEGKP